MRYIRTKDNIIDLRRFGNMPCGVANYMGKVVYDFNAYGRFVVEQEANTIEELCDAYVIKNPKNNIHHFARYEGLYELQTIAKEHNDLIIYGAIWTDKGLIYVAKINDKGELELL